MASKGIPVRDYFGLWHHLCCGRIPKF